MKFNNNHFKEAGHLLRNRKTILTMLKDAWRGNYKMKLYTYLLMILALVYTISPIDLLPDFIPVIGWVDDGILLYLVFLQLKKELVRYSDAQSKNSVVILPHNLQK